MLTNIVETWEEVRKVQDQASDEEKVTWVREGCTEKEENDVWAYQNERAVMPNSMFAHFAHMYYGQAHTDRETDLANKVISLICEILSTKKKLHCACCPEVSGVGEQVIGTMKIKLAKMYDSTVLNWLYALPLVLLTMRNTNDRRTDLNLYKVLMGQAMRKAHIPDQQDRPLRNTLQILDTYSESGAKQPEAGNTRETDCTTGDLRPTDCESVQHGVRLNDFSPDNDLESTTELRQQTPRPNLKYKSLKWTYMSLPEIHEESDSQDSLRVTIQEVVKEEENSEILRVILSDTRGGKDDQENPNKNGEPIDRDDLHMNSGIT
ncbi:uncharacterized protein LOC144813769 [Lissotriton helveticus]